MAIKLFFYIFLKIFLKTGPILEGRLFYFINKICHSFSSLMFFILGCNVSTCLWYFWSVSSTGLDIITVYPRPVICYILFLYLKLTFKREVFILDFFLGRDSKTSSVLAKSITLSVPGSSSGTSAGKNSLTTLLECFVLTSAA